MLIRNKLLLATAIPIALLILQVLLVNIFVRELQLAVQFIGAAQNIIEADLTAKDQLENLRRQVKTVPQMYVQSNDASTSIDSLWQEVGRNIELIRSSPVITSVNKNTISSVHSAFTLADIEVRSMMRATEQVSPDMNSLLVHAISSNAALEKLDLILADLAVELRQQLQLAVDREQAIHNRPIIAGIVIGGLAVLLLMILIWAFVDRGVVRRLTKLSQSMLAIAGGDLHTQIPAQGSNDEIGKMSEVLSIFQSTAIQVQESNRREVIQKRKQRQYWLEHMASFLRHEVRNKQVGAEQSIRLLASKEAANPQVLKYCDRATLSLVDMKELINNTVDAADIESALISEDFTDINMHKLLQIYTEKISHLTDTALAYINKFREPCFVRGDEHRLEQMLDKLVSNAIDFRDDGTQVTIRLNRHDATHLAIEVENIGPALHNNMQALFGLSYSVRSPDKKQQGNVGFGLFVARRIADYHDGTIEAANTGTGAVFTVILPTTTRL